MLQAIRAIGNWLLRIRDTQIFIGYLESVTSMRSQSVAGIVLLFDAFTFNSNHTRLFAIYLCFSMHSSIWTFFNSIFWFHFPAKKNYRI